jgi:hypothetical protein
MIPGDESPGYYQMFLRNKNRFRSKNKKDPSNLLVKRDNTKPMVETIALAS